MAQQPLLPDAQAAFNNLMAGVHQRVFFNTLHNLGRPPQSVKQAEAMIDLAEQLERAEQAEGQKTAAAADDPYAVASQLLGRVLEKQGIDGGLDRRFHAEQEASVKEAADVLAADATIYNSVLSLKAAEAEDYRAALDQQQQ
jgi:hypothetical protein